MTAPVPIPLWQPPTIPAPDQAAIAAARRRQADLTKPPGSLGRLEDLAVRLAGIQGRSRPSCEQALVLLFAADHGVCVHGVSPCRAEVTAQQTANFARGGGVVGVLAAHLGATLEVVDVGVAGDLPDRPLLVRRRIRAGTRDLASEPAMTLDECRQALAVGHERVLAHPGTEVLIVGEMGIGNTTASAALMAAYLGLPPAACCGRGAGLDDQGVQRKAAVVARALERHAGVLGDPLAVLAALGGLEIAAMAGAMIAAAAHRIPVLVDGFIATAAARAGCRLAPDLAPALVYAHRGAEAGHRLLLERLGAEPLVELGLRLGEGSGAEVALPLLRTACVLHDRLTTWEEAGVRRQGT
jgi:nicotinate-nucleotide--dimethylbenzimidazole phosphoribosyltransferase